MAETPVRVLASGLHHPEGVTLLPSGRLACGSDRGEIVEVDPGSGSVALLAAVPGAMFLGLCADEEGAVIACDLGNRQVVRVHQGAVDRLPEPPGGWLHPNAVCSTPDGRLLVSDSGRWSRPSGRLVVIDRDGARALDTGPLAFANGVCFDAAGLLWAIETAAQSVSCFALEGHQVEPVARHDLRGTVPDGLAALCDGSLLVACYRPDQLLRLQGGSLEVVAHDPTGLRLAAPTNLAGFGPGLEEVAIACFGGYHLASIRAPAPVLPARGSPPPIDAADG